jgi:hypothetical protein
MAAARRDMSGVKPTFDNHWRCHCWARQALEVAERCPASPRPTTNFVFVHLLVGLDGGALGRGLAARHSTIKARGTFEVLESNLGAKLCRADMPPSNRNTMPPIGTGVRWREAVGRWTWGDGGFADRRSTARSGGALVRGVTPEFAQGEQPA